MNDTSNPNPVLTIDPMNRDLATRWKTTLGLIPICHLLLEQEPLWLNLLWLDQGQGTIPDTFLPGKSIN